MDNINFNRDIYDKCTEQERIEIANTLYLTNLDYLNTQGCEFVVESGAITGVNLK